MASVIIGGSKWTKNALVLTGTSQAMLTANPQRRGFIVVNRSGNGQVDVDIAGGTVAANTGRPVTAGNEYVWLNPEVVPSGIITIIGTTSQVVNVWESM